MGTRWSPKPELGVRLPYPVPFLGGFIEVSRTMRNKLTVMLYIVFLTFIMLSTVVFVSGILFFILGKNYVFIPIGCCFVVLGIKYTIKKIIRVINTFK